MQTAVKHKKSQDRLEEREAGASFSNTQLYLVNFLQEYGQKALFALLFIVVLFILFYRISASQSTGSVQDYIDAQEEFVRFQNTASRQEGIYEDLERMIENNPELQSRYDGRIAQTLIIEDRPKEAEIYVKRSLHRTHMDQFPYYADFTHTTLDVANDRFPVALEQSKSLEKKMGDVFQDSQKQYRMLYVLNLLREAVLNKQLGFFNQELKLLKEISAFLESPENAFVRESLLKHFQSGSIGLFDYIQSRKMDIENEVQ